jgi:hypothetical protein
VWGDVEREYQVRIAEHAAVVGVGVEEWRGLRVV